MSYRIWSGQRSLRQQWPYVALTLFTIAMIDTREYGVAAIIVSLVFFAMLRGWLGLLRADKTAIFLAATKAEQAFSYLRAFSTEAVDTAATRLAA